MHAWLHFRESQASIKFLEAVHSLKTVTAELEQLKQQSGNFDWDAESAGLEQAKAQLHALDKQASSISGELSGLGKVRTAQLLCCAACCACTCIPPTHTSVNFCISCSFNFESNEQCFEVLVEGHDTRSHIEYL